MNVELHNVTDIYLVHLKRTDSGAWIELLIKNKDGAKVTFSLWSVRDENINFHMGDEE